MSLICTTIDTTGAAVQQLSRMQDLPTDFLMTKLTSVYPPPVTLGPHVIRGNAEINDVTACLWTQDQHLESIATWASRWKGPMSVLITTTHPQNSSSTNALVEKISAFSQVSSTKYRLSVHVLHLAPGTPDNPNAFLNLARALAQTSTVVLFPADLSFVPPKSLQRSISSSSPSSQHKPVIFVSHGQTVYPFTALSPVMIPRDGPIWCTERFFPTLSRSAEWAECLWQFWLETYGNVETRLTTDWLDGSQSNYNASSIAVSSSAVVCGCRLMDAFAGKGPQTSQYEIPFRNLHTGNQTNRCSAHR
ncbi:hypothetical protein PHLGIDRAFT_377383 [Phlebiopsis gigantea 11061_1 CR5-6]|uniref:Glycosyltransferase family 69 protein n=1 Tax=Phlebiopsis gigantea (strain 11061_1 CR5-6) TaxID=745531 RepID=A0A0C3SC17_PHLG1|nr:hypothetical protein PHLGIDRAFT_377383 [Phlebiopsis gigantea 11061_1 CR5-6]